MAIYHFHAKLIRRSHQESSLAAAAYASASRLTDNRLQQTFNYRRKKGVVYSCILAPEHLPDWVFNRETLWNRVELAEKRRDAQSAREIVVALPNTLTPLQQQALLSAFIQETFVREGMIADFSIHHDNLNNPHAHILLTTRKFENDSFGSKVRAWNTPNMLVQWRSAWADKVNYYLNEARIDEQIDHRSYREQGLAQRPTQHLGRKNFYAHKVRNVFYQRALENLKIQQFNHYRLANKLAKDNSALLAKHGLYKVTAPLDERLNEPQIEPTSRKESVHQTVLTNLPEMEGLSYQAIPGDGHCLYNAVGLYLNETQDYLRRLVAAHLEHNLESYRQFITLPIGKRIEDYLNDVRNGIEWATHVEIEVLMRILNRPIMVIEADGRITNPDDVQRFNGEPIFVYYNGHNHYDALLLKEGVNSRSVLQTLLEKTVHVASAQLPVTQVSEHSPRKKPFNR